MMWIVWVFAPLIVLFLLYRLYIKNKRKKKTEEQIVTEEELWIAAEEEEVELCEQQEEFESRIKQDYESALLAGDFIASSDIARKGKEIQVLAEYKRYSAFMPCLDRLSLSKSYSLKVMRYHIRCKLHVMGDGVNDDNVWKYITVEDSHMGAWQVYLLQTLWYSLPLYGHGARARRSYIYSINDFERIKASQSHLSQKFDSIKLSDVVPRIVKRDAKYYASCCLFTKWGGLIRELAEITIRDNKVENISIIFYKTLIKYDCGIMF